MKKSILSLLVLLCTSISLNVYAVSAYPGLIEIKQPNGYILKVRMIGDEFHHQIESEDGYTLLYDKEGYLTLALYNKTGDLQASDIRVYNIRDRRPSDEQKFKLVEKHAQFSELQLNKAKARRSAVTATRRIAKPKGPVIGQRKYLVVLMEFPDMRFKHTVAEFDDLMNKTGYNVDGNQGSVRDFYRENSFGQLELISDVAGIFTAKHEMAYYGSNSQGIPSELAIEAIEAVASTYDLKQYDNDGDGYIDGFHVVFAGYGEEAGADPDCIWSHESTTTGLFFENDVIKMNTYSCTSELRGASGNGMSYIGVVCHEIGHALGTPDFYDVDYASSGGYYPGAGQWDVMANGSWNGDGACPAHFNPYTKIYDFQWGTVVDGNRSVSIKLSDKSKDQFLRINTKKDGEYFLLEYRHQSGFDSQLPGHGLMIWHATDNLSKRSTNKLNNTHMQQFYPIVANNSFGLPNNSPQSYGNPNSNAAPFPGSGRNTEFTDETAPSMKSMDGKNTGFPITNIDENTVDHYVLFDINGGEYGRAYDMSITDRTLNSLTVTWKKPRTDTNVLILANTEDVFGTPSNSSYNIGTEIEKGGKVVYIGSDTKFLHAQLQEHTDYYYRIFSWNPKTQIWIAGSTLHGKTKTGPVTTFPFADDFESKQLNDSWEEEIIYGSEKRWKIDLEYISKSNISNNWKNYSNYVLAFKPDGITHQCSRMILPSMNLGGKKNAVLSFDYINFIQSFKVMYRAGYDGEWNLLSEFLSDYQPDINDTGEEQWALSMNKKHCDLVLPELSNDYQVCFVADFTARGNIINGMEGIIVDNLQVITDNPVFVSTLDVPTVGMTSAEIAFNKIQLFDAISETGIEYSTNQKVWTKVISTQSPCWLEGLTVNSKYYCRAYATTNGGTLYGNIKTFTTLPSFEVGTGTEDDPFLLDEEGWQKIKDAIWNDVDFRGTYFKLAKSMTLSNDNRIKGVFQGHIDGNGQTISYDEDGLVDYFIRILGSKGEIHNVKLSTGALVYRNRGVIHDCDVNFNQQLIQEKWNSTISNAFIAKKNIGTIYSCNVKVDFLFTTLGSLGGICQYNLGLISRCSFEGEIGVNDNATLGGIAAVNYCESDKYGIITQCVNKGNLSSDRAHVVLMGGIAGSNYGIIDQCINRGTIYAMCDDSDEMSRFGGIAGSTDHNIAIVKDSYNTGKMDVRLSGTNKKNYAGGIVGEAYLSNVINCISTNKGLQSGLPYFRSAIVGHNNMSVIENCYYQTGAWNEDDNMAYGKKLTKQEFLSTEFVDQLNTNSANTIWQAGKDCPMLLWEEDVSLCLVIEDPTNITTNSVTISGKVLGNASDYGIEWKAKPSDTWNKIQGGSNVSIKAKLTGLLPATIYEYRIYAQAQENTEYSAVGTFATQFEGEGTQDKPFEIYNYDQLTAFRQTVHQGNGYSNQVVKLMSDIDLMGDKGVLWEPITDKATAFSGEFDGYGHIIRNMKVNSCASSAGFFGTTDKCYVHDLTILNGEIESSTSPANSKNIYGSTYLGGIGGIIGNCKSYIQDGKPIVERCSFTGTIKNGNCIGGIIGDAINNEVKDCYAIGTIQFAKQTGTDEYTAVLGGIAGKGNVENCYFMGILSAPIASSKVIGGIVAVDGYNVNNCQSALNKEEYNRLRTMNLYNDSWRADNDFKQVNYGLPVLISQSGPHLWIEDWEQKENNVISLNAVFYGAEDCYRSRGFEYTFNADKKDVKVVPARKITSSELVSWNESWSEEFQKNIETMVLSKGCFNVDIPYDGNEYIAIRAFARENDSKVAYSEWMVWGENGLEPDAIDIIADSPRITDYFFDLQGRKINGTPTKKGIYIVNGRKIMVK